MIKNDAKYIMSGGIKNIYFAIYCYYIINKRQWNTNQLNGHNIYAKW